MHNDRRRSLKGFTLIELVIVLVIIGMLAAIVVSKLDKVPSEAEDVINQQNIHELNNFVQMHAAKSGRVPNVMDALTDTQGNLVNGPWVQDAVEPVSSPNQADIDALAALGLTNVHLFNDTTPGGVGVAQSTLARLSTTWKNNNTIELMGERLDLPANKNHYLFGLGPYIETFSNIKPATICHCPLVKENTPPHYDYYMLLVEVDPSTQEAEYLGFVDPMFKACTNFVPGQ